MIWIIMPVLAGPDMTEAAISDCLAQDHESKLLVINQGVPTDFRERLERIAEQHENKMFLWSHEPPMPSLSASWNRALDFAWASGGSHALVVNNDVRLDPRTVGILWSVLTWPKKDNLFVTAVGVTKEQFDARPDPLFGETPQDAGIPAYDAIYESLAKGGPDFSCFMISRHCHEKYRFDENFIPAYCEDLDYHRRLMLGGDGAKIFSINLPYWHLAAQTLKQVDPQTKMRIERSIDNSRAYYAKKWGGPVNHEKYWMANTGNYPEAILSHARPDGFLTFQGEPTTPALQAWVKTSMHDAELTDKIVEEANS